MAELKNLKQETTVLQYQEEFESLLVEVDISEEIAISLFLGGLKKEIEAAMRMFKPSSLNNAMYLARLQESVLMAIQEQRLTTQKGRSVTGIQGEFRSSYNIDRNQYQQETITKLAINLANKKEEQGRENK